MQIYIITKGEYSSYRICAATTDKDNAEYLMQLSSDLGNDEARIEVFRDGHNSTAINGYLYKVCENNFNDNNNSCLYAVKTSLFFDEEIYDKIMFYEDWTECNVIKEVDSHGTYYSVYVISQNEKLAVRRGKKLIDEYKKKQLDD